MVCRRVRSCEGGAFAARERAGDRQGRTIAFFRTLLVAILLAGTGLARAATLPDFLWAHRIGGAGDQEIRAAAADPAGNMVVTGLTTDTNSIFTSAGLEDIFLAKYDSAGALLWTRRAGGIGYDEGRGVATDAAGNIYVGGLFQNTASFGTTNLTSSGESDVFLAKYDPSGTLLWVRKAGSADFDEAHSIAVDSQGNVVLTGFFDANATFGTLTLTNTSGSDDIFVAKCNSAGTFLWARKAGGSATNDVGNGIAVDTNANIYVTGYFAGTATFGAITLTSSNSSPDSFLAKYDSSGNVLWARRDRRWQICRCGQFRKHEPYGKWARHLHRPL